jgi:hypothetical protein
MSDEKYFEEQKLGRYISGDERQIWYEQKK